MGARGRLLLVLYGARKAQYIEWSDSICSSLQLINFLQDVEIDYRKGRIYLPQDEMRRYGVSGAYEELKKMTRGTGITKDIIDKIFDPFFTTKPIGVGTGLGLSVCHRIITALGGEIRVESEPGRGTRFFITLPVAEDSGGRNGSLCERRAGTTKYAWSSLYRLATDGIAAALEELDHPRRPHVRVVRCRGAERDGALADEAPSPVIGGVPVLLGGRQRVLLVPAVEQLRLSGEEVAAVGHASVVHRVEPGRVGEGRCIAVTQAA